MYIKFIKWQFCSETDAAATATIRKNNNDRQTEILAVGNNSCPQMREKLFTTTTGE